jgi:hypothetical protein
VCYAFFTLHALATPAFDVGLHALLKNVWAQFFDTQKYLFARTPQSFTSVVEICTILEHILAEVTAELCLMESLQILVHWLMLAMDFLANETFYRLALALLIIIGKAGRAIESKTVLARDWVLNDIFANQTEVFARNFFDCLFWFKNTIFAVSTNRVSEDELVVPLIAVDLVCWFLLR